MNESHYMFVYWILGTFHNDLETLTLAVGIVRSFESVGSAVAFGIGAAKVPPMTNLIIAFVMFSLVVPSTSIVVFKVPERPVDRSKIVEDSASEDARNEAEATRRSASIIATKLP